MPKKHFLFRTKSGVKKLNTVKKAKEVLYFVCEWHLLGAYIFAVAASRLLRYKKIEILMLNIFLTVGTRTPGGTSETSRGYTRRKC
jgi:hypothetical protein